MKNTCFFYIIYVKFKNMDKDKELNDMMAAIKNIKNNDDNSLNIHKEKPVEKDTSFYSRIFSNNSNNKGSLSESESKENSRQMDLQKQLDDYFESVAFSVKIEEMVKQCLLQSVQNQIYMNKLIEQVIKEYTSLNKDMENTINILVKNEIIKLIKTCSQNLSDTLKNV